MNAMLRDIRPATRPTPVLGLTTIVVLKRDGEDVWPLADFFVDAPGDGTLLIRTRAGRSAVAHTYPDGWRCRAI